MASRKQELIEENSKKVAMSDSERAAVVKERTQQIKRVFLRPDCHRFPIRDELTVAVCTIIGEIYAHDNYQEANEKIRAYLSSRFLWLDHPYFQWAGGTSVCDDRTCKALLRAMRATIHTCARDTSWSCSPESSNFFTRRVFGFSPETFPDCVVSLLFKFLHECGGMPTFLSYKLNTAILALESTLDTCLGIPKLRPFFMALAESRIVHICSRIRDYLLAIVIPPYWQHNLQTIDKYYMSFTGCIDIALLTVRDLLDTVGKVDLADANAVKSLAEIRVRGLSLLEITRMLLITLGPDNANLKVEAEYCKLLRVFYQFESDQAVRASTCYKYFLDVKAESPSPFFRDILTFHELDDRLFVMDNKCTCTDSLSGEATKCRECLLRLFEAQKQLNYTVCNAVTYHKTLMHLASDVVELYRSEGTIHLQQSEVGESLNYHLLLCNMMHWAAWHVSSRLLPALQKVSVLTSNFSKGMTSGSARDVQKKSFEMCLSAVNSTTYIFEDKKIAKSAELDLLKGTIERLGRRMEKVKDRICDSCTTEMHSLMKKLQALEENTRRERKTDENAARKCSLEVAVQSLMDFMLGKIEKHQYFKNLAS